MIKSEKGFALLEALIGIVIMGLVVGASGTSTVALMKNYERTAEQTAAVPRVQSAGYWISRDVQTASNVTAGDSNGFPLSLQIPIDMDENNNCSVEYSFDGSKLLRKYYDSSQIMLSETIISDYLETDDITFATVNATIGLHNLTVTVSRNGRSVTKGFDISQRPLFR